MAIFKCKMCSCYDGEWCHEGNFIKCRRNPCDTCRECKIKITEKMSICPYKLELPDWLVWVLSRIGLSIFATIMILLLFLSGGCFVVALDTLLDCNFRMMIKALAFTSANLFLFMIAKSLCFWIYERFF